MSDKFPVDLRWKIAEALDTLARMLRDRPESVDLVEKSLQNLLVTIRRAKPEEPVREEE